MSSDRRRLAFTRYTLDRYGTFHTPLKNKIVLDNLHTITRICVVLRETRPTVYYRQDFSPNFHCFFRNLSSYLSKKQLNNSSIFTCCSDTFSICMQSRAVRNVQICIWGNWTAIKQTHGAWRRANSSGQDWAVHLQLKEATTYMFGIESTDGLKDEGLRQHVSPTYTAWPRVTTLTTVF